MAKVKEALSATPRELMFWGEGKAESIKRGFAITSLRNLQDSYDFARGEKILAVCRDDNEKVPVVIIGNDFLPLSSHEIPVLALDGVFHPKVAAKMLRQYPGYERTTARTKLRAIVFLHENKFDSLPQNLQDRLTNPDNSIISLMRDENFREIFFPTMCFWFAEFVGGYKNWIEFLRYNKLISKEEKAFMENYRADVGLPDKLQDNSAILQKIAFDPNYIYFQPLILGKFDPKQDYRL